MSELSLQQATAVSQKLRTALEGVIKGRGDTIELIITALLADGHVLLEDYPGSGKTTLSKALGKLIRDDSHRESTVAPFKRIQFTPDMLPGDVLGVTVFEPATSSFRFVHGPVFAHIVLADELNRTGPKVQAAFLECMAEKQVTIDNVTHPLDDLFFVIGTQNPLDLAGTYPLPLVQLDRFLLKVPMSYVARDVEIELLATHHLLMKGADDLAPVVTRKEVLEARRIVREVHVDPAIREAIADIMQITRSSREVQFGLSSRAALMLQQAIRARAVLQGRSYVTEEDLRVLCPNVLLHRLKFISGDRDAKRSFELMLRPVFEKLATKLPLA
jgi:MoxR-like ATPase